MSRPFSASHLRRSPSFRRLAGVSVATFDRMVGQLRGSWDEQERRKLKSGRPWETGGLEDHLLIMLVYYRCYVTQEFIGQLYRVDRSAVCRAIKRIEAHAVPLFAVRREPRISRKEAEALIVDCTEQPIERPGNDAVQKAHYSGKKKRHTLKTEFVVTASGRIVSVSPSHPGSRHDLAIRRQGPPLPKQARVYADSAYQGQGPPHPGPPLQEAEGRRTGRGGKAIQPRPGQLPRRRRAPDRARQALPHRLRPLPQPAAHPPHQDVDHRRPGEHAW